MQQFVLQPFQLQAPTKSIAGTFQCAQSENKITINLTFKFENITNQIEWPAPQQINHGESMRRDNLWQSTCFELFVSETNDTAYSEFNFSPSGHWQSYHFLKYRQPSSTKKNDDTGYLQLKNSDVVLLEEHICVTITLEYLPLHNVTKNLNFGICAVILDQEHKHHYYALAHHAEQPDFHLRSTHLLTLNS